MRVGSLVEYVKPNSMDRDMISPKFNTPYTVRALFEQGAKPIAGIVAIEAGIYLEEIENKEKYFLSAGAYFEDAYCVSSFRELQPPISNIEEHINENTLELQEI